MGGNWNNQDGKHVENLPGEEHMKGLGDSLHLEANGQEVSRMTSSF